MTDRRKAWLLKAMMITASASVLAACQTTSPYVERRAAEQAPPAPPLTPAPMPGYDNPPEPPPPAAAPSGTISSEPLPPAPAAYTPPPPPPPAYTPPPAPPAPPQYRTVTTGRVVDADGPPKVYTVKPGDALDAIAREMGLTRKQLADLNDLEAPYLIKPGQKLTGPKSKAKAYIVVSGDTLSAIGRRFSVSAQAIADANDIERSDPIRPNQKLVLPDGYKDLGAQRVLVTPPAPSTPAYNPPTPTPTPTPAPAYTPPSPTPTPTPSTSVYNRPSQSAAQVQPTTPTPTPVPTPTPRPAAPAITPAAPASSQIQTLGRGKFIWPLRGRVISGFSAAGAMANKGLNISAPSGTTVRAAAGGQVIYAGSQLSDYGNLVLIQHDDGFISVYAHLSRILVQNKAEVRQNQEIGEVGQTGGVTEPQLYFEMRFAAREADKREAFDPMLVLPRQ
jgi:murein DD-endopeptidase MepM/ murein hydrolase activator NlpD